MKFKKFNIIFFIICFSISIAFFSYVFYKSEIFALGTKHDFYFKYYILSILIFLTSFFSLILKKEILIRSSLVIFSTLFSFYAIEYFLDAASKRSEDDNLKYIDDFKKPSPNLVPVIYFADHFSEKSVDQKFVPLAGISNKETIFCKEDGPLIRYKSDRYGFNNNDSIWLEKNIFAITIGDSFTHGACVERKNTIANNIDSKKYVLNLGIGGTGPLIQYAILREYLNKINPEKIIWIYYEENDLSDLIYELSNSTLREYLIKKNFSQDLISQQKKIDKKLIDVLHLAIINKNKKQTKDIIDFIKLKKLRTLIIDRTSQNETKISKEFVEIMKKVKEMTNEKNVNLYFVYLPEKSRFKKEFKKSSDFRQYKKIKKIINDLNIPIIDLNLEFQKRFENPLSLYNKNHPHLNANGYRSVGKLISEGLRRIDE